MRRFLLVVAWAGISLLSAWPNNISAAQQRAEARLIPDSSLCTRCSVSLVTVATIRGSGAGAITSYVRDVSIDSRNRIWVSVARGLPMVFDSTGRFIREVGASGSGPG